MNEEDLYVNETVDDVWNDLINKSKELTKQDNPKAILVGGQPGAGKSTGLGFAKERLGSNAIINSDEFREFHPKYNSLYEQYGDNASEKTQEYIGKMTDKIKERAIDNQYNIVLEGTFKTVKYPLQDISWGCPR